MAGTHPGPAHRRRPGRVGRVSTPVNPPQDAATVVRALLDRSRRLGADRRNTNYAGGNTSAKGTGIDPATGVTFELLWVKGSRCDLRTLTKPGLAVLRLDRLLALVDVNPGGRDKDAMVGAFGVCLH